MAPAALVAFCEWLSMTPLSLVIQERLWVIPMVQTVHILAIAVVIGSVGMIDLKLLGLAGRSQSVSAMIHRLLPAVWIALVVLLLSGSILIIGEPLRSLANPAFQLKMLLLLLAIALTLFVHRSVSGDAAFWELTPGRRASARLAALVSLMLWIGIVFAGRWIAYTDYGFA